MKFIKYQVVNFGTHFVMLRENPRSKDGDRKDTVELLHSPDEVLQKTKEILMEEQEGK